MKENIIDLFSISGKLLGTYKSSDNLLQINNLSLPEGIYLLNDRNERTNSTKRMIIKE
jgi:hypothetical protein